MAEEERRKRTPTPSRPLPKCNRRRMEQLLSSTKTALFSGRTDKRGRKSIDSSLHSISIVPCSSVARSRVSISLLWNWMQCEPIPIPMWAIILPFGVGGGGEGARLLLTQNCTAMPPPSPPPAAMDVWRCGQEEKGGGIRP